MIMFVGTVVHPLLTLIITMELSVFIFFIVIYSFAINRYMPFILWPITVSAGAQPRPGVRRPASLSPMLWRSQAAAFGWKGLRKSPAWGKEAVTHLLVNPPGLCSWQGLHYGFFPTPVPAPV